MFSTLSNTPRALKLSKLKTISLLLLTVLLLCSQLPQLITWFVPLSNQGKVQSQLYLPATASADNPAPLLVFFGGSEGGMSMTSARSAPERQAYLDAGFALLVVGYFGLPGIPAGLDRIELGGVLDAIEYTRSNPAIAAERLSVLGVSKGAELALLLASRSAQISTVIAVVGSDVVFASPQWYSTSSSWSWQGQPIAFVPFSLRSTLPLLQGNIRRSYEIAMQNQQAYQQALIPVQQMQADVLLISGTADELWPSSEMSDRIIQRLQQHHYPYRYQHLKIAGGGHGGLARQYQSEIVAFLLTSQR
ncbi:alpha/beta hydrolase [Rheinheimera pleomorphica]|uniref:alpha/beta hydrolase n=1 Tax=Rheinheimera pleomorphica TaxID=2703963 RepID=UPI00141F9189|nr:acyl-CoA thioester hydrolase/BAAT C-terminal domain-containing protein [Rheinheimera pleomorphica]